MFKNGRDFDLYVDLVVIVFDVGEFVFILLLFFYSYYVTLLFGCRLPQQYILWYRCQGI